MKELSFLRWVSVVLLVAAVTNFGRLHCDLTGTVPMSLGLTRISRDMMRRAALREDVIPRSRIA